MREMRQFAGASGMSVSTLGRLAGCGGNFYARLESGRRAWPETVQKVRDYIAAQTQNEKGAA